MTIGPCSKCINIAEYAYRRMCRKCYNAKIAVYMLEQYHRRRREAVAQLGGKCVRCGSIDKLEIDHKDRSLKSFSISKILASAPEARYKAEIAKCQLLCKEHHTEKTSSEQTVGHGGGLTGVRHCWCELCAPLKRRRSNEQRKEKRRQDREAKADRGASIDGDALFF